jgi:TonB family protein
MILFSLSFSVNFREKVNLLPHDYISVSVVEETTNKTTSQTLFSLFPHQVLKKSIVYKEKIDPPNLALRNMGFLVRLRRTHNGGELGSDRSQNVNIVKETTEDSNKENIDILINNVAGSEEMNVLNASTKENESNPPTSPFSKGEQGGVPLVTGSEGRLMGQNTSFHETVKIQSRDETLEITKNGINKSVADLFSLIRSTIDKAKTYPLLARKRGMEGTVIVSFKIDRNGLPHEIKILKGSGYQILDEEVPKILRKASPFPELDGEIVIPITFKLTESESSY